MATSYNQGIFQPQNPKKYLGKNLPHYRSGWELVFLRLCDSHPAILQWSYEAIKIPYVHPITGKKTNYVPDFFIVYLDKNGKKHSEIVEIKPSSHILENAKGAYDKTMAVINQAKWHYAQQFCKQMGVKFRIVTENEMFRKPQKPTARRGPRKSVKRRKK